MNYKPMSGDVAMDLQRCAYFSTGKHGFDDKSAQIALRKALSTLDLIENSLDPKSTKLVRQYIKKASNPKKPTIYRQEYLLTASMLLLHS